MDISGLQVALEVTASRKRPTDVERVCADVTKINECTGWKSEIDLVESLKEMWNSEASR
jgi:UDP-glucose 4-epimerase